MAKGVNKVTLLGNLGRAAEVRTTGGGTTVATFSLATPDRKKDARGEWVDHTEWHTCVAFGRTAEIVRDYTAKGSKLYIEGKLQTRSWDDKTSGEKKYRTEILVNEVTLLDGKRVAPASDADDTVRGRSYDYVAEAAVTDDDIPF